MLEVLRRAFESWSDHRTIRLGAALAYYSLFAAVPLFAVSIFVAGLIFSVQDVGTYLVELIGEAAGSEAARTAANLLTQLESSMSTTGSGVILFIATVVTASFVFVALQDVMNLVWEVPPRHSLRGGLRRRIFAVGLVLLVAALLSIGLIASAILNALATSLSDLGLIDFVATAAASVLSTVILAVAVVFVFKYVPKVNVGWHSALVAGAITTIVLVAGTSLMRWYLGTFSGPSLVGAASALLGVFARILESEILLARVELNRAIEHNRSRSHQNESSDMPEDNRPT